MDHKRDNGLRREAGGEKEGSPAFGKALFANPAQEQSGMVDITVVSPILHSGKIAGIPDVYSTFRSE